MIPFFTAAHVERAVSPERALDAVREAFVAYARGEWTMPPKVYVPAYPAGDFRAMPALGGGHALLKWVTSFPGNPAQGLPTVTGIVLLSDASNGALVAALDAGAVTAIRTGAAAVLAAETLGRAGRRERSGRRLRRERARDRAHVSAQPGGPCSSGTSTRRAPHAAAELVGARWRRAAARRSRPTSSPPSRPGARSCSARARCGRAST